MSLESETHLPASLGRAVGKPAELLQVRDEITEDAPLDDARVWKYLNALCNARNPALRDDLKVAILDAAIERGFIDSMEPQQRELLLRNLLVGFTGALARDFPKEGYSYLEGLQLLAVYLPEGREVQLRDAWIDFLNLMRIESRLIPEPGTPVVLIGSDEAFDQFRFLMNLDFDYDFETILTSARELLSLSLRRAYAGGDPDALPIVVSTARLLGYLTKSFYQLNYYCENEFDGYQRLDLDNRNSIVFMRRHSELPRLDEVLKDLQQTYAHEGTITERGQRTKSTLKMAV